MNSESKEAVPHRTAFLLLFYDEDFSWFGFIKAGAGMFANTHDDGKQRVKKRRQGELHRFVEGN